MRATELFSETSERTEYRTPRRLSFEFHLFLFGQKTLSLILR